VRGSVGQGLRNLALIAGGYVPPLRRAVAARMAELDR
jgi:hypothetical protein